MCAVPAIPTQYQCPICCDLLDRPVKLPCCGTHCCYDCFQQGLELSSSYCFFCRKRLASFRRLHSGDSIVDKVLQKEIEEAFPDGRDMTALRSNDDGSGGDAIPPRLPPEPGELQREATKLMEEYIQERTREAALGEEAAKRLYYEHVNVVAQRECQLTSDARLAEELSKEMLLSELRRKVWSHRQHTAAVTSSSSSTKKSHRKRHDSGVIPLQDFLRLKLPPPTVVVDEFHISSDDECDGKQDDTATVMTTAINTPPQHTAQRTVTASDSVTKPTDKPSQSRRRVLDDWVVKSKRCKSGAVVDLAEEEEENES